MSARKSTGPDVHISFPASVCSVWAAGRPPGYAFVDFYVKRDAQDAICLEQCTHRRTLCEIMTGNEFRFFLSCDINLPVTFRIKKFEGHLPSTNSPNPGSTSDAGDAVMARWLQSAESAEEKQRLFKLMRNLNFNGESGSEPFSPTTQSSVGIGASDGFYSTDFRGDFGAGLLDLHAIDDTELLTEV
ncbi:hypothetical protein L2E82_28466 [Cichorium intybus]|uniref:Uncharacterized protein n=1 Tax=Cichorium intybus TaxID=13427 RepID=A0ACB9CVU3_CICIN|nr:hypothetical protein L2E82_28466 [Cichorium intybus]